MTFRSDRVRESKFSRSIALFLAVFFGWAGLHRFYVRKTGTGFIMFFTFGGFGMWWFLDVIAIISGVLTDEDNFYVSDWRI